ncbi:MAG: TIGR02217 family protein, partial [Hyphomicrobiales bacterium]
DIALGATGGPERRTTIVTLASGFEERNAIWADSRRRYDAGYGVKSLNDLHGVIEFFEARLGRLHGFRWKDRADFRSGPPQAAVSAQDCALGTGDATTTTFQLVKTYSSGSQVYARTIKKPVAGTVMVALDGVAQSETTDFSVDITTGIITFVTAPGSGVAVTAGFEFDTPVRFDSDRLDLDIASFQAGAIPSIPVVEIRL